tara:strand:+ start:6630 stop:7106 length:477 start_codon:yes stop_codon:yes gene_type:complete
MGRDNQDTFLATILLVCGLDAIRRNCGPIGSLIAGVCGCAAVIAVIVLIIVISTQTPDESKVLPQAGNSSLFRFSSDDNKNDHRDPYYEWRWVLFDWWWILIIVVVFGFGTPLLFWEPARVRVQYTQAPTKEVTTPAVPVKKPTQDTENSTPLVAMRV